MKIFNTFTRKKEDFVTIDTNKVKMYICGQTVYDYCHLGHARKAIVFDMVRRWFINQGYQVVFVENITDIDDKIINKALAENTDIKTITERYIGYMLEDFDNLGIMRADYQPRATDYISEMGDIIQDLINKNYAYIGKNGDIFYRVNKFVNYGRLSGKSLDSLNPGERVEVDNNKENPMDFVLWKTSKENEPTWTVHGHAGRPGWHIECSAMAEAILGKTFDIHGGGLDLQFPHHENEIAQSEAHNDCKLANYWMHNGFLNINDEKMSKSLGNFFTLRDVLDKYHPEIIRLFMLKTHYRSPLNFSEDILEDAKNNLTKFYLLFNQHQDEYTANIDETLLDKSYIDKFTLAMNDDFNTALSTSYLYELLNELNREYSSSKLVTLLYLGKILGLFNSNVDDFLKYGVQDIAEQVEYLINKRKTAKIAKDFALSDKIRDEITGLGVVIEDSKDGTFWRKI